MPLTIITNNLTVVWLYASIYSCPRQTYSPRLLLAMGDEGCEHTSCQANISATLDSEALLANMLADGVSKHVKVMITLAHAFPRIK